MGKHRDDDDDVGLITLFNICDKILWMNRSGRSILDWLRITHQGMPLLYNISLGKISINGFILISLTDISIKPTPTIGRVNSRGMWSITLMGYAFWRKKLVKI